MRLFSVTVLFSSRISIGFFSYNLDFFPEIFLFFSLVAGEFELLSDAFL